MHENILAAPILPYEAKPLVAIVHFNRTDAFGGCPDTGLLLRRGTSGRAPRLWRRPLRSRWLIGLPFGTALGILYSVTTISGPPLAILFNNQGLVKNEFRAGLALVRVAESSVTAIVYFHLGLFVVESQNLISVIMPSVVVGIPLGAYVIRRLDSETFRRICMSFDAWIVGFGLSRVLIEVNLMGTPWAYSVMAVTILIDIYLLYIFFSKKSGGQSHNHLTGIRPGEPD
jgi:hypothetical protein